MKRKRLSLIFVISTIFVMFSTSCKKDLTDETDITNYSWRVEFIKDGSYKTKVPNKDYHGNSVTKADYILTFSDDSVCSMTFSINQGGGKYYVESVGRITITIGSMTEICCDSDFDIELSQLFSEMEEYKVINSTLILEGNNKVIQLKKE